MEPVKHTLKYGHVKVTFPLSHIFCGEIKRGTAGGFHSRPGGQDPPGNNTRKCARPWKKIPYHVKNFGFPAFEGSEVFNANTSKWIHRDTTADENGYYGFFPNQWTVSDVVNKVSKCTYECCQSPGVKCGGNSKTLLLTHFNQTNSDAFFDVTVFLTTSTEMCINMVSAFPVKSDDYNRKANYRCDVQKFKNKCL